MENVELQDFTLYSTWSYPISIAQCITFSDVASIEIEDIALKNVRETAIGDTIVSFQCSAFAPCKDITLKDVQLSLRM